MPDFRNTEWNLAESDNRTIASWEKVSIAVLMDIRRELRALNALLACPNFTGIPRTLKRISANTAKPKRKKRTADR